MLDTVLKNLGDPHFLAFLLAGLGCAATALMVVVPLLQTDNLSRRIKAVSTERERIRLRERERLTASQNKTQLRVKPSTMLKNLVDSLNLTSWLGTEKAKETLAQGGLPRRRRRIRFRHVSADRADRLRPGGGRLHLRHRPMDPAAADADRLRHVRDVSGRQGARTLSAQCDHQAAEIAGARLSELARSDVDLRRIGHVDRTHGAQGERRSRRRKHRHGRGADPAGGGNVLSPGSAHRLRELQRPHRARIDSRRSPPS